MATKVKRKSKELDGAVEVIEVGTYSKVGHILGDLKVLAVTKTECVEKHQECQIVKLKRPDGTTYLRKEYQQSRVKFTVEIGMPEWMRQELKERRGYDDEVPDEDLIYEAFDAIMTRFGGSPDWKVIKRDS